MANVNLGKEDSINVNLSNEKPVETQLQDLNYIPAYKDAEKTRRENEEKRIANETERQEYYKTIQDRVAEGGLQGPPNIISIGTVVGGEEASVTIEGNSPNQVLNFVLPKGKDGEKGESALLPEAIKTIEGNQLNFTASQYNAIDFIVYGNCIQSTTPTPNEPSEIQVVDTITLSNGINIDLKGNELCFIGDAKDSYDLVNGKIIKQVGKITFNGSENWYSSGSCIKVLFEQLQLNNIKHYSSSVEAEALCDYFPASTASLLYRGTVTMGFAIGDDGFYFANNNVSLSNWKSWLAENPVTVYFTLKESKQINIDSYKIPLQSINNISLVDTIPTNMRIKYYTEYKGEVGERGEKGDKGDDGQNGSDGLGVPLGGTAGQVLAKKSDSDNDTEWIDPPEGTGGSSVTVVDNLESNSSVDALSAKQGKLLSEKIQDISPCVLYSIDKTYKSTNTGTVIELSDDITNYKRVVIYAMNNESIIGSCEIYNPQLNDIFSVFISGSGSRSGYYAFNSITRKFTISTNQSITYNEGTTLTAHTASQANLQGFVLDSPNLMIYAILGFNN